MLFLEDINPKKLVVVAMLGLLGWFVPVAVQAQLVFVTNADHTITITGYSGTSGIVTIPSATNSFPVVAIGNSAFTGLTNLTNVVISSGVATIGTNVFNGCTSLTNITIPNSVTNLGGFALASTALQTVSIPASVASIGGQTFFRCTSLTNISVDPLNSHYASAEGVLFDKSLATIVQYPDGKAGGYVISNTVITVGAWSFAASALSAVTISSNVASVGDNAFYNCSSLTNLAISNSVASIGVSAFQGCIRLPGVSVPVGVASIGSFAFANCSSLVTATLPNTLTNLGDGAFYECLALASMVIPNGITGIGENEFLFCQSLTNISIPNSVTSIGNDAFVNCTSLSSVTIPDSVTSIGSSAFQNCSSLTSIYFMGSVPAGDNTEFTSDSGTVYYLPGMAGWSNSFAGLPTAQWFLPNPFVLNQGVGVRSNAFSFTVSWATNASLVMEATTNLTKPTWLPVLTNPMVNGTNFFRDVKWTNYPHRFYRLEAQ